MTTRELSEVVVALLRDLAVARSERDSYRAVAVAGIHHAHDLHIENARLRRAHQNLQDEYRRFGAEVMRTHTLRPANITGDKSADYYEGIPRNTLPINEVVTSNNLPAGYEISTGRQPESQVSM